MVAGICTVQEVFYLSAITPKHYTMKKIVSACLVLAAMGCSAPAEEPAAAVATPQSTAPHDYGMKASYSSDFTIGNTAHGDAVVKLWKMYDENNFSDPSMFADSVTVIFPGYRATLHRDSLVAMVSAERSAMDSCHSELDAIVPLKPGNKNESVVCIWGTENTVIKGTRKQRDLQEVWGFNEEGKVTWMKQYVHELQ